MHADDLLRRYRFVIQACEQPKRVAFTVDGPTADTATPDQHNLLATSILANGVHVDKHSILREEPSDALRMCTGLMT